MDAAPLREFSDGCTECNRIASNTEVAAANGQVFRDGEISIIQMGKPLIADGTAQLALRVDQARFVVVDASGTSVDGGSEAYTNISGGVALEWNSSDMTWSMTQLTRIFHVHDHLGRRRGSDPGCA
jgi:hypothetical protein